MSLIRLSTEDILKINVGQVLTETELTQERNELIQVRREL